ncbi:hypothetical protein M514_08689 [Trichuris suis]|uniref:Uncharacterized protein n=1 Tax=Trichuris suis TaxID=68888 RepID=A0A085MYQ3_9BILA|nr:hypothetical protein M513_08689 [Trichuris suis]KFD62349.1 hypothetical protein M514_08689 [Trichuris suis]
MTRRDFSAIKTRTNLIPTCLQTNRGQLELGYQRTRRRHCGEVSGAQESLIYIAQNCLYNHRLICRRQNEIVSFLVSLLQSAGFNCVAGPLLEVGDAMYEPALVISKEGKCWTMDI